MNNLDTRELHFQGNVRCTSRGSFEVTGIYSADSACCGRSAAATAGVKAGRGTASTVTQCPLKEKGGNSEIEKRCKNVRGCVDTCWLPHREHMLAKESSRDLCQD